MFARTGRLLLRPAWIEDGPAIAALLAPLDEDEREILRAKTGYGAEAHAAPTLAGLLLRRTFGAPRPIGLAWLAADGPCGRIGCWVAPALRGLGYGGEAVGALVAIARDSLRLDRIVTVDGLRGPAAERMLARAGFRAGADGRLRLVFREAKAAHSIAA